MDLPGVAYENVLQNPKNFDFQVQQLGPGEHANPSTHEVFIDDGERIAFSSQIKNLQHQFANKLPPPAFEKAGARKTIFHNPASTRAAIITCGGLCPGLNNVIKGLVNVLEESYGVEMFRSLARHGSKDFPTEDPEDMEYWQGVGFTAG